MFRPTDLGGGVMRVRMG